MAQTFRQRWDAIITVLRSCAETWEINPEMIMRGEWGEMPMNPPCMYVFLEPGSEKQMQNERGHPLVATATCTIYIAHPGVGKTETQIAALERAGEVLYTLYARRYVMSIGPNPIELDEVQEGLAIAVIEFVTEYTFAPTS